MELREVPDPCDVLSALGLHAKTKDHALESISSLQSDDSVAVLVSPPLPPPLRAPLRSMSSYDAGMIGEGVDWREMLAKEDLYSSRKGPLSDVEARKQTRRRNEVRPTIAEFSFSPAHLLLIRPCLRTDGYLTLL